MKNRTQYFKDYYQKNKLSRQEYLRQWRKANQDKQAEYNKKYSQKESVKEYRKSYSQRRRVENPEHVRKLAREFYYRHREEYIARSMEQLYKRRARLAGVIREKYTKDEVMSRYGGYCIICDDLIDVTLKHPNYQSFSFHHIVPIARGGADTISNIGPAHLICNIRAGSKMPIAIKPVVFNG